MCVCVGGVVYVGGGGYIVCVAGGSGCGCVCVGGGVVYVWEEE